MVYCVVRSVPPPRAFLPRTSSIRRRPCTFRTGARRIPAPPDLWSGRRFRPPAAGKLAVVLKVDAVQLLAAGETPDLPHPVLHIGPLFRRKQQGGVGVQAHGHVVEVPGKHAALGDQQIQEVIAGDHLVVPAGVADGNAEGDAVAVHQVHGVQGLLEVALTPVAVVGLLEALHADGYKEITHPQHLPAELLVDEGAVGEGMEGHIPVLFTQADDVLGRGCRGALSHCIIRRIPILPAPASAVQRGRWYSFRYRSAGL